MLRPLLLVNGMVLRAVVCIIMLFSVSDSSEQCRKLYPLDIDVCDLEGNWFFTMVTHEKYQNDVTADCSGFTGRVNDYDKMNVYTTGRAGLNPSLQVKIKNRQVYLESTDPNCKEKFSFKAAIIQGDKICFYSCGGKDDYDYAQCFTKRQRVTETERVNTYNELRYFGLTLREADLKIVDRCDCATVGEWRRPGT